MSKVDADNVTEEMFSKFSSSSVSKHFVRALSNYCLQAYSRAGSSDTGVSQSSQAP